MISSIFLSHFLDEQTPGYGGSVGFQRTHVNEIAKGSTSNSQKWTLSNHVGTHIDLPAHFDDKGDRLEAFTSSQWIMEKPFLLELIVSENEIISYGIEFDTIPLDTDFLIFKTGFQSTRSEKKYWNNGPGLSPDLAKWIRSQRPNIKILGFDFISITSFQNRDLGRIAHREFLGTDKEGSPLRVIEDMKLDELMVKPKRVTIAPLLVRNADGAPVTIIAEI